MNACWFSFEFKVQKGLIQNYCDFKFIYSEKATKFCEISSVDLSQVGPFKSMVEILQNFVALSEYMNFTLYRLHSFRWPLQRACSTWTCHLIYDVYPPAETLDREREKNLHLFSKPKQNAISCFIDFLPSLWKHFGIAYKIRA